MPYLGNSPQNNVRQRYYYTATAGQTVFSGTDSNGLTLSYQDGKYLDVYLNGVLLQDTIDYTALTKNSVTLAVGATVGDLIEIVAYGVFSVSDTVSASRGGTFSGDVAFTGNVTATDIVSSGTVSMGSSFMRNKIINGDMRIDQRNAGASVSNGSGATDAFVVDRWNLYGSVASKFTGQRNAGSVTPPAGYSNYAGMTVSSAYTNSTSDYFRFSQRIEGLNISDLSWGTAGAQPITITFWVRSSVTGTHGGSVTNGSYNRSYPFTYTISSANTWEFKTLTIPGDTTGTWATDNTNGIALYFGLGVGSVNSGTAGAWTAAGTFSATGAVSLVATLNATWYITGVQLEAGSVATPFERRQYGQELALCQRYYVHSQTVYWIGYGTAGTVVGTAATLPVQMRAAPSVSILSSSNTNTGANTVGADGAQAVYAQASVTATGGATVSAKLTAAVEL